VQVFFSHQEVIGTTELEVEKGRSQKRGWQILLHSSNFQPKGDKLGALFLFIKEVLWNSRPFLWNFMEN